MTLPKLVSHLRAKSVRQPGGCLTVGNGSARRYWSVAYDGKRRNAHQAVWEFEHGPIPAGLCVCHSCDNPRCIEPTHLWLGTAADNMHDRDRKGRNGTLGENARTAKLRTEQVLAIRAEPNRDWPAILGVSRCLIRRVVLGHTWRHIPCPACP